MLIIATLRLWIYLSESTNKNRHYCSCILKVNLSSRPSPFLDNLGFEYQIHKLYLMGLQREHVGYGDLFKQGYGLETTALSTTLFNSGATCGAFYEIMCVDNQKWCWPGSIHVTMTNSYPANYSKPDGNWCNPLLKHFDLSQPMFRKIAIYKAGSNTNESHVTRPVAWSLRSKATLIGLSCSCIMSLAPETLRTWRSKVQVQGGFRSQGIGARTGKYQQCFKARACHFRWLEVMVKWCSLIMLSQLTGSLDRPLGVYSFKVLACMSLHGFVSWN